MDKTPYASYLVEDLKIPSDELLRILIIMIFYMRDFTGPQLKVEGTKIIKEWLQKWLSVSGPNSAFLSEIKKWPNKNFLYLLAFVGQPVAPFSGRHSSISRHS